MKIVFMGSPEFAVPCLQAVAASHEVVLVVSQPDKPAGRGGQVTAPPVKQAALALGLPTSQPRSARTPEFLAELRATGAELAVVVAYGKILPRPVLEAFARGCVNVHASLLPRYRGAAPVQWSVIGGDAETGVAIMQLDEGMDTGPVLLERRVAIGADETSGQLLARLAPLGAAALLEAIDGLVAGTVVARAQDHAGATHARMLEKSDGEIDFGGPAAAVAARIRGVDPWPGAQAVLRGQVVKLFGARAVDGFGGAPGTVLALPSGPAAPVIVACGEGAVALAELQAAGRKRLTAAQFAAGRGIAVGDVLGAPVAAAPAAPATGGPS